MKKRSTLIILAALILSACASTPPVSRAPMEVDSDYVGAVERHAKSVGADVYWVNPPRRERAAEDQG